jgi:hypothetical protein
MGEAKDSAWRLQLWTISTGVSASAYARTSGADRPQADKPASRGRQRRLAPKSKRPARGSRSMRTRPQAQASPPQPRRSGVSSGLSLVSTGTRPSPTRCAYTPWCFWGRSGCRTEERAEAAPPAHGEELLLEDDRARRALTRATVASPQSSSDRLKRQPSRLFVPGRLVSGLSCWDTDSKPDFQR